MLTSKALNDLAMSVISVEEGLKMSIEWYEEFIGDRMLKIHHNIKIKE